MRRVLFVSVLVAAVVALGVAPAAVGAPAPPTTAAGSALNLAQAQQVVRDRGYTPIATGGYEPAHDLSVIVGLLSTSGDGHPQQAFFFHRGQFVGTDTTPSAGVEWVWSTSDVVALQYDLYHPADPLCCPTAGGETVRYQWNGSTAVPLDSIPSSEWSAATSRR